MVPHFILLEHAPITSLTIGFIIQALLKRFLDPAMFSFGLLYSCDIFFRLQIKEGSDLTKKIYFIQNKIVKSCYLAQKPLVKTLIMVKNFV